jgi:hypothetical protein
MMMMCSRGGDVVVFVQCMAIDVYTEVAFVSISGVQRGAAMTTLGLIRNVVKLPYGQLEDLKGAS